MHIPEVDCRALFDDTHPAHVASLDQTQLAATETGFMTVTHTGISGVQVSTLLDAYHRFFLLPQARKAAVNMAGTGSNRGWGAPGAEQVDPSANPDFKEVFDCGPTLSADDPLTRHTYYAANRWPAEPADFRAIVSAHYRQASEVALALLGAVADAIGESATYFHDKFDKPMALLRGNYYPPRPASAGERDFGIAPHTDYGCLTLLATDGTPGLEVQTLQGTWVPVVTDPGTFVINFGEMLQAWTGGRVVATPHRVIGSSQARLSVPFFFNPRFDVNVAPAGSGNTLLAGEYLARRYDATYTHRRS